MPFGDYDDWDDCINKNRDKDDPEAYCGKIKHETEDFTTPDCVFNAYDSIYSKYPDLDYKDILDMSYNWCEKRQSDKQQGKDFVCSEFWDFVKDFADPLEELILQRDFYNYLLERTNDFLQQDTREGEKWITIKGRHILIGKGKSIHFKSNGRYEVVSKSEKKERVKEEVGKKVEETGHTLIKARELVKQKEKRRKEKLGYKNLTKEQYKKKAQEITVQLRANKENYTSKAWKVITLILAALNGGVGSFLQELEKIKKKEAKLIEKDEKLRKTLDKIAKKIHSTQYKKDFIVEDVTRKPKTETNPLGGGRPKSRGLKAGTPSAMVSGAKRTKEGQALIKAFGEEVFEAGDPDRFIKVGNELLPIPTLTTPAGTVRGRLSMTNRPLEPVMSSNVMGRGVLGSNLYVQFHSNPGKIYKYSMASPEVALEAFEAMAESSPGRYVWNNLRGRALGPVFGKPQRLTPGGTIASIVPYDKMNYSRVRQYLQKIPGYEELSEQWKEYKMSVKGKGEGATSGEPFTKEEITAYQKELEGLKVQKERELEEIRKEFERIGIKRLGKGSKRDMLIDDTWDELVEWVSQNIKDKQGLTDEVIAWRIAHSQGKSKKKKEKEKPKDWREIWASQTEKFNKMSEQDKQRKKEKWQWAYKQKTVGRPKNQGRPKGSKKIDTISVRETENYTRKRQFEPSECEKGTYRTFEVGKGKKAVGCKVNGKFKVQSILEPKKKDYIEEQSITSDFITVNDTTLGGYVVRDGPFRYGNMVKYKTAENLKEAYLPLKHVIAFGSQQKDSHTEGEDRFIGYWDNFKYIPKGTVGDYEPFIDYKYNRIQANLHTKEPLEKISTLKEYKRRPVSASYEDLGTGLQQRVGKVHHIAVSLDANEQDRCDTEDGTPCGVFPINHDQNTDFDNTVQEKEDMDRLNEEALQTEILEQQQMGVLRADFSQPPINKKNKEIDDCMSKKDKKMKKEDEEYDDEEESMDMKTEDSKKMINGVMVDTPAEGDDDRIEDKIMGSNLFGTEHFVQKADFASLSEKFDKVMDMMGKIMPTIEKVSQDMATKEDNLKSELLATLTKDPYNFPKEKIQDFTVEKLQEQKDLIDSLPVIQDYIRNQPLNLTHEDVNKHFTDFEMPQTESPALLILQKAQGNYSRNIKDMGSLSEEGD